MPRIVPKSDSPAPTSGSHNPIVSQKVRTNTTPFAPKAPAEATAPAPVAPEAAPAATPAAPAPEPVISNVDDAKRFAALSREDKRIREARQALKMQEDKLKAAQQPADSQLAKVLRERGLTEEQLVSYLTGNVNPNPEEQRYQQVTSKLSAVEEQAQRALKALEDQQLGQRQQAIKQMRYEAEQLAASDDKFAAIKHYGAFDEVTKRIEEKFDSDNIVMSVEEAMTAVEAEFQEQVLALSKIPKFAALLAPKPAEPPKPASSAATLTHSAAANTSLPARNKAELRQRMIDRLNAMKSGS